MQSSASRDARPQSPEILKAVVKYSIVFAAILSGAIGWTLTGLVLNGSVEDFRLLDSMTPTAEATFDNVFIIVLVAGLAMFSTSLLGCIGVLRGHKGIVFAFSVCAFLMACFLTVSAVCASMILTGSIPPIIMETNRVCRNQDQVRTELQCGTGRRLEGEVARPWTLAQMWKAGRAVRALQKERRLEAGTTELQLIERIAANQNEDKCAILTDICKLPEGVKDMTTACTCNGLGVFDMQKNSQADMDWACPQRIATEHASPECGSFCADWDGSGDLSKSWCFVNINNQCDTHIANLNETFGPMEPSVQACEAFTLIEYPWSGMVARGIYVAKVGMGLTSCLAALMYYSVLAAWFIIWCTPGNKFYFSEAMALQPLRDDDVMSESGQTGASQPSSRPSRPSSFGDGASTGGRSGPAVDSTPYMRE